MRVYTFNADGPVLIELDAQEIPSGPRIGWGDGPPVDGYWRIGDRIYSTNPEFPARSWTCVAEGFPGTWLATGGPGGAGLPIRAACVYDGTTDAFIQNTGFSRVEREAAGQYRFFYPEAFPLGCPMVSFYARANNATIVSANITVLATETEIIVNVLNGSGSIVDSIINLYLVDAVTPAG